MERCVFRYFGHLKVSTYFISLFLPGDDAVSLF
jgi:hypothetical protein